MKLNKSVIAAAVVVCFATMLAGGQANAAPCSTSGTFADLQNAGSCTIGDKTFSNFTYNPTELGGATEVPATAFDFTTINDVNNQWGFEFTFPLTSGVNQSNDIALGYTVAVTNGAALIDSLEAGPITGSISGTGTASVGETYCLAASTTVGCPSADLGVLGATLPTAGDNVTIPGENCLLQSGCPFFDVSEIAITKDLITNGGTNGSASLSILYNTVDQATVPEPASLSLLGVGLFGIGAFRRFRKVTAS